MSSTALPGSPATVRARAPRKEFDSPQRAIAALDVDVPLPPTPAGYGLAMGLLVAWLGVICLVYAAVVLFFGYLLAWHVRQAFDSFATFHLIMAFVGGLLLLFLVKPLFLRPKAKEASVLTLMRESEPTLFAFVDKLCEATGSPAPAFIEVDCEANAAAKLDGFISGRVVLRLGLPLVAALNARQLAGVIAHEFGHFGQRGGMRASGMVRRMSHLFGRIVFQRDRMDAALLRLRTYPHHLPRLLYRASILLIESARGVLWLMLVLSELFTCGALRRMEYDADRLEATIAGTRDFIVISKLLAFLSIAYRQAQHDLSSAWDEQRLADDFPRLIVHNALQLADHKADVVKRLEEQKTSWFDTHPCHADRVRMVEELGAEGVVKTDALAKSLFADFEGLCHTATQLFYNGALGEALKGATLVPAREIVARRSETNGAFRALRRFFQGRALALRPVFPSPDAANPATNVDTTGTLLAEAREVMGYTAEQVAEIARDFDKSGTLSAVYQSKLALYSLFSGGNSKIAKFRRTANRELNRHESKFVKAVQALPSFEVHARDRLTAALQLYFSPSFESSNHQTSAAKLKRAEIASLIRLCAGLEAVAPLVMKLRDLSIRLRVFLSAYNPQQPFAPVVNHVIGAGRSIVDQMAKLRDALVGYRYPFEHTTPDISVGMALVHKTPNFRDPGDTLSTVSAVIERYCSLSFRSLAKLTACAEEVETSLGLSPLPEPPDEEDVETQKELARQGRRKSVRYWSAYGLRAFGGVVLLCSLVWLSVSPPTFNSSSRGQNEPGRPTPFRFSFEPTYSPPRTWRPRTSDAPISQDDMPTMPDIAPHQVYQPPQFHRVVTPRQDSMPNFEPAIPRHTMPPPPTFQPRGPTHGPTFQRPMTPQGPAQQQSNGRR